MAKRNARQASRHAARQKDIRQMLKAGERSQRAAERAHGGDDGEPMMHALGDRPLRRRKGGQR